MQGKRLGMIKGNYLNLCFDKFVGSKGISVQKFYYSSGAEVNEALAAGKIDAIMSGNCVLDEDKKLVAKFDYLPAYIITGKNNTALMEQLDQAMRAISRQPHRCVLSVMPIIIRWNGWTVKTAFIKALIRMC